MQSTSFYSISLRNTPKKANALLFIVFQAIKKSNKNDIKNVGIKNSSIELNVQTKLESHLVFLVENLFLDKNLEKNTNLEDYFPTDNKRFVVDSNIYI